MCLGLKPDAPDQVVIERRPRFEGSNIGTWIGFKHVMYLVEEGALQFLREHGVVAGSLFERYALGLEIVDSSLRLLRAIEVDDVTRIDVTSRTRPDDLELRLDVEIFVGRNGQMVRAVAAEVRVLFRQARPRGRVEPPPAELVRYLRATLDREAPPAAALAIGEQDGPGLAPRPPAGSNAFVWKWRIPYFYCHFTEHMQHSGYVRVMEEVVDLFLADRGISIQTLLRTRDWIPVVAEAKVELLRDAYMEETLYTVFTVEEVFKRMRFTARMDCYVPRDGGLVRTATGRVTHAYLHIADRGTGGRLATFDDEVMSALCGSPA